MAMNKATLCTAVLATLCTSKISVGEDMCLSHRYLFKELIHTSRQKSESSQGTLSPACLSFLPFTIRIEDGLVESMSR